MAVMLAKLLGLRGYDTDVKARIRRARLPAMVLAVLGSLLAGAALGLSLAAPPGAMNALIADTSRREGALKGIQIGLAAPVADLIYLSLLLLAQPLLEGLGSLARLWALAGGAYMLYLAWGAWKATRGEPAPARSFGQAFLLAISNPFQLLWWLTAGVTFLSLQGPIGLVGFVVGIFSWVAFFSWVAHMGSRKLAIVDKAIHYGSPVLLVLFGILMLAYALLGYQI